MKKNINRKQEIILTSIEVISDLGFQGFTTKEIAKKQGISESTLYRHFNSKNDILAAVMDYFSKYDEKAKEKVKSINLSSKESIVLFFKTLAQYYHAYPELSSIMSAYGSIKYEDGMKVKTREIFNNRIMFISELIEEGIKNKELKADIECEYLVYALVGAFRSIIGKWRNEDYEFRLEEKVTKTIEMIVSLAER